jgi:monoamine oxidase
MITPPRTQSSIPYLQITFSPALSERKQHAIQALGFGVQNRVYLTFDRVYWDDSAHTFHCVSDPRYLFFNMNRYGWPHKRLSSC